MTGAGLSAQPCVIGVDVGTGSARAGVFTLTGQMLGAAKQDIALFDGPGAMVEQSSADIWQAVCRAVRGAMAQAGIDAQTVVGVGFDATCSLVVLGAGGVPLPVGPSEDAARNIIVWMDHRAIAQSERINAMGHAVLDYVGGRISPEMQTPKLMWLLENRPHIYASATDFFDLVDFLTWRATGDRARSTCTVTCKWTYVAQEKRWDADYFGKIGLGDLADDAFVRIGQTILEPGTPLGAGLTGGAAADLGLLPGTAVAAGMIDAHAGGLGSIGSAGDPLKTVAYVFGTSSCTMTTTEIAVFVPGVWGPYYSAMMPGLWLIEGGQSAAGAAIDQLLSLHPAAAEAARLGQGAGQSLPAFLAAQACAAMPGWSDTVRLADGLHVVPEFLGNRAPFADPHARAVISGLGMARDVPSLTALYIAGLCGVGYGLRQILAAQDKAGAHADRIAISGGAGQSDLVRQILADATGLPVIAAGCDEPVLLGAAILATRAAGVVATLADGMVAMSQPGRTYTPAQGEIGKIHAARYAAFCALQATARSIRNAG